MTAIQAAAMPRAAVIIGAQSRFAVLGHKWRVAPPPHKTQCASLWNLTYDRLILEARR
jgi:hypothetical protein